MYKRQAYSYMALIPLIQPPIMRALTTKKERETKMDQLRPVSKTEKIVFPVVVAVFVILLLPSTAPLIGCLMLGNLMRECGVVERLSDTAQNALMNIVTIFLSVSVGATTVAAVSYTHLPMPSRTTTSPLPRKPGRPARSWFRRTRP